MESLIVTILFFLVRVNVLKIERFKLDINPISPIYWVDSGSVLVNESEESFIFNIESREKMKRISRKGNILLGSDGENGYLCRWKNREIGSVDEFSTHLVIDSIDGKNLLDIELKPTLEVVECRGAPILKTVFPIKEKYYLFKDRLYEVKSYDEDLLSPTFKRLLLRDSLGNYWVWVFSLKII
jgi:hypothetical protein